MRRRRRVWVHFGMAAVAAAFVAVAWVARPTTVPLPPEFVASKKPVPPQYADDARCAACHPDVAAKFAHSGMGRAFNTWKDAEPIEDRRDGPGPVLTLGDLHYQVVIDGGRMFQREFRVVDGREVELNRREAAYALGSGTKGRGYLATVNGYLTALPLSWYSSRQAWDFSPGYRKNNVRFSRPVRHECMACHNAPFGVLPGAPNGYVEPLPAGLGCQRCHGPGADHVAFQERGEGGSDPMPRIARLDPRAQIDVCLQCHLLSDHAVPRGACEAFRPGDRLADCRVDYFRLRDAAAFDAVGHGPRSMASKCYTASGGKLTCTLCHDPHRPAAGVPRETYNRRCDDCHQVVLCKRPLRAAESPRQGDCVSCHMPARKADDIPHATSTEHWIHVPGRPLGAPVPRPKEAGAKVAAWTPGATAVEDALARIRLASDGDDEHRQAVATLEERLKQSTTPQAVGWMEAAKGWLYLGEPARAKDAAGRALAADPRHVAATELYAFILGQLGDFAGKAEVLERLLRSSPWCNASDAGLLDALARSRAERRAFELYDRYLQFHPPNVDALLLLGELKRRLKAPSAEAAAFFEKAAAADGARPEPYLALARLARADGVHEAAARHAHAAALRSPQDAVAWALEAGCWMLAGDRPAARKAAEQALALDPNNADAARVLRDIGASPPARTRNR